MPARQMRHASLPDVDKASFAACSPRRVLVGRCKTDGRANRETTKAPVSHVPRGFQSLNRFGVAPVFDVLRAGTYARARPVINRHRPPQAVRPRVANYILRCYRASPSTHLLSDGRRSRRRRRRRFRPETCTASAPARRRRERSDGSRTRRMSATGAAGRACTPRPARASARRT